jgi:hypothetical protein
LKGCAFLYLLIHKIRLYLYLLEKIPIVPGTWIRILWFVNTLANSFGINGPWLGSSAMSVFTIIIKRLRLSCRIVFREMEPLFLATICGCNAGLFLDTLHKVYIRRIQRGNASFAANILGARGALLSVLAHFFEHGRWGYPVDLGGEGQRLTAEDQLFVLTQAGLYLLHTRGMSSPEAQICWERAEPLCHSLNRPELLYSALAGQYVYSLMTDKLSATMQIVKRVHSLAQEQNDPALIMGACRHFAVVFYYSGDFESGRQYAMRGLQI